MRKLLESVDVASRKLSTCTMRNELNWVSVGNLIEVKWREHLTVVSFTIVLNQKIHELYKSKWKKRGGARLHFRNYQSYHFTKVLPAWIFFRYRTPSPWEHWSQESKRYQSTLIRRSAITRSFEERHKDAEILIIWVNGKQRKFFLLAVNLDGFAYLPTTWEAFLKQRQEWIWRIEKK